MKFSIARESFLAPLSHVASVIEKNQIIPILANVVLTVKEGWLELIGSDQEVQLKARVELAAAEDGAVTVPARRLLDIFRLLPDHSRVSFELRDDRLLIRSGSSRFNLITLPVENYPAVRGIAIMALTCVKMGGEWTSRNLLTERFEFWHIKREHIEDFTEARNMRRNEEEPAQRRRAIASAVKEPKRGEEPVAERSGEKIPPPPPEQPIY